MQDLKDLSDEQLYRQSIINKYNLHVTGVQETRAGGGDETATNPNDLFFEGKLKLRTWLVCREYTHDPRRDLYTESWKIRYAKDPLSLGDLKEASPDGDFVADGGDVAGDLDG